jgi:ribonucleoside-diphosphate reductase beta chain
MGEPFVYSLSPMAQGMGKPKPSFWPSFFAKVVAKQQWNADAIDLAPDARAWTELPDVRRDRLTKLLAGFRVAEDAVSEQLEPFIVAAGEDKSLAMDETLVAWVLFLQRRDEQRHARLFDRIAEEVLQLPGDTPADRRESARSYAPTGILDLFEDQLPALAAEISEGRAGLGEGVGLYHMVLEGIVFTAGQHALLDDLADDTLPGIRRGVERVELDERWHIGFGLRCLMSGDPSPGLIDEVLARAQDATAAWGDAVSAATRAEVAPMCARRLSVAGLMDSRAAA